jgi:hypothetical protein
MGIAARTLRTEAECLAKAAEMTAQAARTTSVREIGDLLNMARCWRKLAGQATWQDGLAQLAHGVI